MTRLLHIDASPRSERSHSRKLTRAFVNAWQQAHPADLVTYRDLGHHPLPHVDEPWIAAAYTAPEQRSAQLQEAIRLSDQLIDELLAADLYVMGIPMYNFSVPSTFKAYIDQIVRPGLTFVPADAANPYRPLVRGKKMVIITARGASGYGPGGRYETTNHHDPYLSTIFGFIGITDISFIHIENDELGGISLAESIAAAQTQVAALVECWGGAVLSDR